MLLLELASAKHKPEQPQQQPIDTQAIEQTKQNKLVCEKTSAVLKYQDKEAYVVGTNEKHELQKVNCVNPEVLKTGRPADFQSDLKKANLKMAYEPSSPRIDNETVVKQVRQPNSASKAQLKPTD